MKRKFYFLVSFVSILIIFLVALNKRSADPIRNEVFHYSVDLDSFDETYAFFGGGGSYFFQYLSEDKKEIEKVASFPWGSNYYATASSWGMGHGLQAMSISNRSKLPDGFSVRWYSPFENEQWEARGNFNFEFFKQLQNHYVELPFNNYSGGMFFDQFDFRVNVGPKGRIAIW